VWLPLFRDANAFKVAYGFGLRRTESAMLDLADFGANPHAAEFGDHGLCRVRFGKASRGPPPKRRSVLTVWPWLPGVLGQWIEEVRPLALRPAAQGVLRLTTSDITRDQHGQAWSASATLRPCPRTVRQPAHPADQRPARQQRLAILRPNPGHPTDYSTVFTQLRDLGSPIRTARVSALRRLILQTPGPVIAEAPVAPHVVADAARMAGSPGSHAGPGNPVTA